MNNAPSKTAKTKSSCFPVSNVTTLSKPRWPKGLRIRKKFDGYEGWFEGTIEEFDNELGYYSIKYDDGDKEELEEIEILQQLEVKCSGKWLPPQSLPFQSSNPPSHSLPSQSLNAPSQSLTSQSSNAPSLWQSYQLSNASPHSLRTHLLNAPSHSLPFQTSEAPSHSLASQSSNAPFQSLASQSSNAPLLWHPSQSSKAPSHSLTTQSSNPPSHSLPYQSSKTPSQSLLSQSYNAPSHSLTSQSSNAPSLWQPSQSSNAPSHSLTTQSLIALSHSLTSQTSNAPSLWQLYQLSMASSHSLKNQSLNAPSHSLTSQSLNTPSHSLISQSSNAPSLWQPSQSSKAPSQSLTSQSSNAPSPWQPSQSSKAPSHSLRSQSSNAPSQSLTSQSSNVPSHSLTSQSSKAPFHSLTSQSSNAHSPSLISQSSKGPSHSLPSHSLPSQSLNAPSQSLTSQSSKAPSQSLTSQLLNAPSQSLTSQSSKAPSHSLTSQSLNAPSQSLTSQSSNAPSPWQPSQLSKGQKNFLPSQTREIIVNFSSDLPPMIFGPSLTLGPLYPFNFARSYPFFRPFNFALPHSSNFGRHPLLNFVHPHLSAKDKSKTPRFLTNDGGGNDDDNPVKRRRQTLDRDITLDKKNDEKAIEVPTLNERRVHLKWNNSTPHTTESIQQLMSWTNYLELSSSQKNIPKIEVESVQMIGAKEAVATLSNKTMCDACVKAWEGNEEVRVTRLLGLHEATNIMTNVTETTPKETCDVDNKGTEFVPSAHQRQTQKTNQRHHDEKGMSLSSILKTTLHENENNSPEVAASPTIYGQYMKACSSQNENNYTGERCSKNASHLDSEVEGRNKLSKDKGKESAHAEECKLKDNHSNVSSKSKEFNESDTTKTKNVKPITKKERMARSLLRMQDDSSSGGGHSDESDTDSVVLGNDVVGNNECAANIEKAVIEQKKMDHKFQKNECIDKTGMEIVETEASTFCENVSQDILATPNMTGENYCKKTESEKEEKTSSKEALNLNHSHTINGSNETIIEVEPLKNINCKDIHFKRKNQLPPRSGDSSTQFLSVSNPSVEINSIQISGNQAVATLANEFMGDACVKTWDGIEGMDVSFPNDATESKHSHNCKDNGSVDLSDKDISVVVSNKKQTKTVNSEHKESKKTIYEIVDSSDDDTSAPVSNKKQTKTVKYIDYNYVRFLEEKIHRLEMELKWIQSDANNNVSDVYAKKNGSKNIEADDRIQELMETNKSLMKLIETKDSIISNLSESNAIMIKKIESHGMIENSSSSEGHVLRKAHAFSFWPSG